jgi:hypothetical protein
MKMENSLAPALFIASPWGSDILNSLARPAGEVINRRSNGDAFLSWMKQAGLLSIFLICVLSA